MWILKNNFFLPFRTSTCCLRKLFLFPFSFSLLHEWILKSRIRFSLLTKFSRFHSFSLVKSRKTSQNTTRRLFLLHETGRKSTPEFLRFSSTFHLILVKFTDFLLTLIIDFNSIHVNRFTMFNYCGWLYFIFF